MNSIAKLFASIGFQLDPQAQKKLDDFLGRADAGLRAFATRGKALVKSVFDSFSFYLKGDVYELVKGGLGSLAGALDPRAAFESVKAYAASADALAKKSRALGVTVEALEKYRFIAGQNGIALEEFEKGVAATTRIVGEASQGSTEHQTTLRKLGLSYRALGKMSAEARFDLILERLAATTDETKRAALGSKLLGEQFPSYASLLKGGPEGLKALRKQFDDIGGTTTENAENAEVFNDTLDRLTRIWERIKAGAVEPLIKPLTTLLSKLEAFVMSNKELVSIPFDMFGSTMVFIFGALASAVEYASAALELVRGVLDGTGDSAASVNAIVRLGVMALGAYGLAWLAVNSALVQGRISTLLSLTAASLKRVFVATLAATKALWGYIAALRTKSAMEVFKGGLAAISKALNAPLTKTLLMTAALLALALIGEDLYRNYKGQGSLLGEAFGVDSRTDSGMRFVSDILLGITAVVGAILLIKFGIVGAIVFLVGFFAWLFSNWDYVIDAFSNFFLWIYAGTVKFAEDVENTLFVMLLHVEKFFDDIIDGMLEKLGSIPSKARAILSKLPGAGRFGFTSEDALEVVASPGATSPAVDAQARAMSVANNRSVNVAPTVNVTVDARGASAQDATEVVGEPVWDALFRQIERAYDGE